jgi:hypothetical protein
MMRLAIDSVYATYLIHFKTADVHFYVAENSQTKEQYHTRHNIQCTSKMDV